jgi:molybdopterin-guanine dinucleotide biosynthesis protein A
MQERPLISMEEKMEAATAPVQPETAGFVLAGGRSSRMGADKSLVVLDGEPLVAHALDILRQAGLAASVSGGQPGLSAFAPLIQDNQSGLGPLSGICAALASTSAGWAVFLSVDLPLLPSSLVAFMLRHASLTRLAITVCSVNGFAQTFPAVVRRTALPMLERELESGRRGCYAGFQAAAASMGEAITVLAVESLVQCGQVTHAQGLPASRWFLNVNTIQDLIRAKIHSHRAYRVS